MDPEVAASEPDVVEGVPDEEPLGAEEGVVDEPGEDVEDDAEPAEPIPDVEGAP